MVVVSQPISEERFQALRNLPAPAIPWRQLIASDRDRLAVALGGSAYGHREHRYRGGPPPLRLRRMQLWHETRARAAGVPWDVIDLRRVYAAGNGKCGICHQPVGLREFTIDHITPLSKGGPHLEWNLQLAHRRCNSAKGNK